MAKANEIGRRAIALYLDMAGEDVRGWLMVSVPFAEPYPEADGYLHVSNISDRLHRVYRYVLWRPDDDSVMLGPERR